MSDIAVTVTNPGSAAVTIGAGGSVSATVSSGGSVAVNLPGGEAAWENITGKPTAFTPAAHQHVAADITDRATALVTSVNGQTGAVTVAGGGGGASLSDSTPRPLGPAAAGTSSSASRADHVHALPTPADIGASPSSHGHPYVTALNTLTGALTLAAGSNVTITPSGSTLTIDAENGGAVVSDDLPESLAPVAFAGLSNDAARADHVHPKPSAADIGALDPDSVVDGGEYVGVYMPSNVPTITITQQPTNKTAANGLAAFVVQASASNSATVSYQWQKQVAGVGSWSNISGAVLSQLSLSGLTPTDDGDRFRAIVSADGIADVLSNAATLTVPDPAPSVSAPVPAYAYDWFAVSGSVTSGCDGFYYSAAGGQYGTPVWPIVSATPPAGASSVTYQWQVKNVFNLSQWTNIAGAQSATYDTALLSLNYKTSGGSSLVPIIINTTTSYTFSAPAVRCLITADGSQQYSEVRPILIAGFTSPATQGAQRPACSSSDAHMIKAWEAYTTQFNQVAFANSGNATVFLPYVDLAMSPIANNSRYDLFLDNYSRYTGVWEKSSDGGLTWSTFGPIARTAYSLGPSDFQLPATTDSLSSTAAGTMYRARLGAENDGHYRASIFTMPIRIDYVVIGFNVPTLANQTANAGAATFSISIPAHGSGVPIGGSWERSTNGGTSWTSAGNGTRAISGTNTVMSLALTGLTSANNQTLYRFVAKAHGYGNVFGRSNAATLTVQ